MWYHTQALSELNRLQQNFHPVYGDLRHVMFIATDAGDGTVIGFCDIDGRDPNLLRRPDLPPRPYLSDLAVSFKFRRRGVGTALVRACERACQAWGYQSVFLKVEAENRAGLALYRALGYVEALPPDAKNQILLSRTLGPGLEADMLLPPPQTPLQSTPASASSLSLLSSPAGTGAGGGTVLVSGGGGSSSSSISDSGGASIGGSGGDGAATIHEPAESLVAVAGMAAAIAAGLPPEDMGPFCRL